jgi:putative peptidoglycan lipid II flippase
VGRVQSIVARVNQRLTIQLAATFLAGSTLLSAFLGIYRDSLLNSAYYHTYKVGIDAYTAAFAIPDFMFYILVSGALSVTFIPVFTKRLATGNRKSAWELSSSLINMMAVLTMVASILIIIFAGPLVKLVAYGLNEQGQALAISMMRVIAVNPFLFAIATVIASMQQAIGRYTVFALAPILYNIGIITGVLWFTGGITIFGHQVFAGGIMGVALGVVLGSILQLIVSSLGLIGIGFDYNFKVYWKNKGFRQVLKLLPPRSLDQGMDYIIGIFEYNIASRLGQGTLRAYQQATTLHMMPVNLIGVAISTAAFPTMSEDLALGNFAKFKSGLQKMLRVIIWLALPVAVMTFVARNYVVSFIVRGGDPLISGLLGALVGAILFRTVYHIVARGFYAQSDTKTPLYISIVSIILDVSLALWFCFTLNMGPYGLAIAQSIVAFVEVVLLLAIIDRRIPGKLFDRDMWEAIFRMASAAGITAVVGYIMVNLFQLQKSDFSVVQTIPKFTLIVTVGLSVYLYISYLFKLKEAEPVIARLRVIFFNNIVGKHRK